MTDSTAKDINGLDTTKFSASKRKKNERKEIDWEKVAVFSLITAGVLLTGAAIGSVNANSQTSASDIEDHLGVRFNTKEFDRASELTKIENPSFIDNHPALAGALTLGISSAFQSEARDAKVIGDQMLRESSDLMSKLNKVMADAKKEREAEAALSHQRKVELQDYYKEKKKAEAEISKAKTEAMTKRAIASTLAMGVTSAIKAANKES